MGRQRAAVPGWAREAVRVRRASIPVGHSVRAALTVGVPVALGFAFDEVVAGLSIGLACLLRAVGERRAPHRTNVTNLLIATPIAGCGYLFAAAQDLPLVALVALMGAAAFVAGLVEPHGEGFTVGTMQFLLVASIEVGVPDDGVLRSLALFLAGSALYAACMALDYLVFEPEPGRAADPIGPGRAALRGWLEVDAATLRRAGRLALCFAIAVSARGWVDVQNWYWVPASVGLIMQPSLGSVPGRAVLRVVGTCVGALVAAVVIAWSPGGTVLAVVVGLTAATIPWAKLASYALQSASLAAVVVLLVEQLSPSSAAGLPVQRIVATAVGGAIVFVFGYAIWPEVRRLEAERAR